MALLCKTPTPRVGMVDRLSPIDRNLEATADSKTKKPNSRKTPPLARRAEPLGTMALLCKTPTPRVGMVDRLSPIDRNLKATADSKTKKPNSRKTPTLARRAEPLGTMALHCKTPPHARRRGAIGGCWGEEKKRSRNRSGVLLFSGRFKDSTAHRKCGWVLLSPIDSKDE
jgi:hypothetical protein